METQIEQLKKTLEKLIQRNLEIVQAKGHEAEYLVESVKGHRN